MRASPRPAPPACSGSHDPREEHSYQGKYTALGTPVKIMFSVIASRREEPQRLGRRTGFWLRGGRRVSPAGPPTSGLRLSLGIALLLYLDLDLRECSCLRAFWRRLRIVTKLGLRQMFTAELTPTPAAWVLSNTEFCKAASNHVLLEQYDTKNKKKNIANASLK